MLILGREVWRYALPECLLNWAVIKCRVVTLDLVVRVELGSGHETSHWHGHR